MQLAQKVMVRHRLPQSRVTAAVFLPWISVMKAGLGIRKHMGNGLPDFAGMPGIFSKSLFNGCHLDIERGPVKGNIGLVIKSAGITARSPDRKRICRPGQLVGQPVQPADHGAEKIQGTAAILIEGAHQFQRFSGHTFLRQTAGKCLLDIRSRIFMDLFLHL